MAKKLSHAGWKATSIHGDRSQSQRNAALRSFSQGGHRVLVATDVAARGIDVEHIAHVVNYDLPKIAEDFVHRVGRTGRASRSGVASTFALPEEKNELRKIERDHDLHAALPGKGSATASSLAAFAIGVVFSQGKPLLAIVYDAGVIAKPL